MEAISGKLQAKREPEQKQEQESEHKNAEDHENSELAAQSEDYEREVEKRGTPLTGNRLAKSVQVGEGAGIMWRRRRRGVGFFRGVKRALKIKKKRRALERRAKSPTRPPTNSPTNSRTNAPTTAPTQPSPDYYAFPTGTPRTQKVETCRKLMTKREVRKWLQMTTRRDVKVARQAKQHLVAKQESARAEASSARAAVEAAKNGLWVMQNSKYSRSVKKLIAGVSKEGKKQLSFFERSFATTKLKVGGGSKKKKVRMCGRKLMGESRHLPSLIQFVDGFAGGISRPFVFGLSALGLLNLFFAFWHNVSMFVSEACVPLAVRF